MPMRWTPRVIGPSIAAPALALLAACAGGVPAAPSAEPPAESTPPVTTVAPTTATGRPAETRPWVALQVGDCLAEPPPTDPAVVLVTVVDCAAPHAAEVFDRVPVPVNAAIAEVADVECAAGFVGYTGVAVAASGYRLTYLIDSVQDRTGAVPEPSTVLCLLHPEDGSVVTGTARR
ncbi:hypothetical protein [Mycobacterium sp. 1274756.6]|uniref:hypothetical protein n=1 Tax=Mycobacterium sp. 1274756.6 TaxID=1834076 RepID=UPI000A673DDC|nr:hypothetical protein [Mycobacterium sp. 1274756.6]